MNLNSVADIESELEICKSNLKRLQKALAEEKFKVIYLQTTMARRQGRDPERVGGKDENFNADRATCSIPVNVRKPQRRDHGGDRHRSMGSDPAGVKPHGEGHTAGLTSFLTPQRRGFSGRTGKPVPIPVPPRMMCFNIVEPTATKNDSEPGSDREYEDAELNENFVRNNLLTPKLIVGDNQRSPSSSRDTRRPFRHSRDFDSSDDGRLSPSFAQGRRRASRGSGCSTPERRSDGYLSSDHEDSSSAGNSRDHPCCGISDRSRRMGTKHPKTGPFVQPDRSFTNLIFILATHRRINDPALEQQYCVSYYLWLLLPPACSSISRRQIQLQRFAPATFGPRVKDKAGAEIPVCILISCEGGLLLLNLP